jgi:hypothetical protein
MINDEVASQLPNANNSSRSSEKTGSIGVVTKSPATIGRDIT